MESHQRSDVRLNVVLDDGSAALSWPALEERVGWKSQTFWRNKHPESLRMLPWSRTGFRKDVTLWLWGLNGEFILTPVYQPDCSSDPRRWSPPSETELEGKCTFLHGRNFTGEGKTLSIQNNTLSANFRILKVATGVVNLSKLSSWLEHCWKHLGKCKNVT